MWSFCYFLKILYPSVWTLFMKTIVSICVAQFFQVAPAHLPSCLLLEDHCLQKSWLCSGQRDLCWLTECCCHNLSSWLLRRISCRPQSSSPESSETCNFPWSSQSPHTYVDGQQGGVLQDLCEFQHALQGWGSGPWKSTKSPKRANLFGRWACMPAFTYSYMLTSS